MQVSCERLYILALKTHKKSPVIPHDWAYFARGRVNTALANHAFLLSRKLFSPLSIYSLLTGGTYIPHLFLYVPFCPFFELSCFTIDYLIIWMLRFISPIFMLNFFNFF